MDLNLSNEDKANIHYLFKEFRKNNIGFIFQQYYLLQNLNVEKNVRMGADLVSNNDYKNIIKAVGLEKKSKVLFLDEPTGALDEKTGRSILDYISKLQNEEKFTIVMITHNENIAEMAKTIIKINSGKIVETINNKEQKTAYEIGW